MVQWTQNILVFIQWTLWFNGTKVLKVERERERMRWRSIDNNGSKKNSLKFLSIVPMIRFAEIFGQHGKLELVKRKATGTVAALSLRDS